jgi:hypothetical protein
MMKMVQTVYEKVELVLYPDLRPYERTVRDRMLKQAADTPLDLVEWGGIIAALVLVAVFTRYSLGDVGVLGRVAVAIVNFLVAFALLGVIVGPFLIRRTRRGLRSQIGKQ